jgi:uncharacterized protein (DUF362 family)
MAKVAIAHTGEKHRSIETVYPLVKEAVDLLGGMGSFVKPGQTVIIKPNNTVFYSAEEGCTTDPLVVASLIRLAREAGASRIQVGESSGGFFSSLDCMRITGIAAIAEREGAEVIDLGSDSVENRVVPVPKGKVIREVPLPVPLLDADVIISAPKAKNHHIEPITCAMTNWVGAVNQNWREHNHGDTEMLGRFADIMTVIPPTLCVVDAIIAGEGDGPIADQPRWCGCVLASTDPVATDVTVARLMGHDPEKLNFAKEGEARGLGSRQNIEYAGVPLEEVSFQAWPGHQGYDYLPLNFLVGKGVTLEGTIGHIKSVLDSMLRRGELWELIWAKGTPTIMIGEIDDPNFEMHLKQGPYIVVDDAAKPQYKNDPRVFFICGHPVLRTAMPKLIEGLGAKISGKGFMKWQQFQRWGMHNLEYGSPKRKAMTLAKPVAAAVLVGAAIAGVTALVKKAG